MTKSTLKKLFIMACFILLSATGTVASSNGALHNLSGTKWRLVEFQSMDDAVGVIKPESSSVYTMQLNADGSVNMQLNCNRAQGKWFAESGTHGYSGRFEFGELASTRALCPPPSMDESIVAQSKYIRSYYLKGNRLYLSLFADAGIYVWERKDAPSQGIPKVSPDNGGPLNWKVATTKSTLNLRQHPSILSKVVSKLRKGTILDNLDCQVSEGRTWCYVQPLGGGPVGYVAANYLRPAISPNGIAITGPDDSALRAGQGDFDATGQIPCAFSPGQPMAQCKFGVARTGGGYATVVIERPDSRIRAIYFRMGIPIGADTSEADGYHDFNATKESDLHFIRVGKERYEIPDAVILGG
jgi:heat shock protein HslJ